MVRSSGNLVLRITEYLSTGGLFNPELMDHEKVRDLLMDCREELISAANTTIHGSSVPTKDSTD